MYQPIIEFIDREIERLQQARSILVGTKSLPYKPATVEPPKGDSSDIVDSLADFAKSHGLKTNKRKRWSKEARQAHSERLRARWRKRKADESRAAREKNMTEFERQLAAKPAAKKSSKK